MTFSNRPSLPFKSGFLAIAAIVLLSLAAPASAEMIKAEGWKSHASKHGYKTLVKRLDAAAKANKMGVVTRASATVGAKMVLKKDIPGNMVVGLYHPRFAVPMLEASIPAGIEAPIRIYLTENSDGTATLSYKMPSFVFAPYMAEGGDKLKSIASELDAIFEAIATATTSP